MNVLNSVIAFPCWHIVLKGWKRSDSGAGKLTYCAFFDKSTNFGTEVDQYILNKFGVEPPLNCPLAAVAAIFQNGPQQTYNRHQKVNIKFPAECFIECFEPIRAGYYQDSS